MRKPWSLAARRSRSTRSSRTRTRRLVRRSSGGGRHQDAEQALLLCLALAPEHVDALVELTGLLLKRNDSARALEFASRAVRAAPGHTEALLALGNAALAAGDVTGAEEAYRSAAKAAPGDERPLSNLAIVLWTRGRPDEALALLSSRAKPGPQVARWLARLLSVVPIGDPVPPDLEATLVGLIESEQVDPVALAAAASALLERHPAIAAIENGADPVEALRSFATKPLALALLSRSLVSSQRLELALRSLRSALLERALSGRGIGLPLRFICALGQQLAFSEHPWPLTPEESASVARLRALPPDNERLALLSLFIPLSAVPGIESVAPTGPLRPLLQTVADGSREAALARAMPTLTEVSIGTSGDVRAMYEESPYPPWVHLEPIEHEPVNVVVRRHGSGPDVAPDAPALIAGCGTGRHALQRALASPASSVLAVDLSRRSLAYGARQAERLGVHNVRFTHADILQLGRVEERFALIESVGVLHHLANPWEGLRVLAGLLAPGGVMRLGFYSLLARRGLTAAREVLARHKLPPGLEGVRAARQIVLALPSGHPGREALHHADFWSTSACRDLLLHVCQHELRISDLRDGLKACGLRFRGMETSPIVRARLRASGGDPMDLEAWERFEEQAPDTFAEMYLLWCERAGGV